MEGSIRLPGVREAVASAVELIASCARSARPDDPGLFGPDSISWRICRNPAYAISALSGLLMGALHPVAMAAIDQHSDYRRDAWRRAHRTTSYVFTITFGSSAVALRAAERVRSIHSSIAGTDPVSGRTYRADDPDLLLWIHCVNTEMALAGQEAFGGGLSAEESDRYVSEQARAAALVGLPEASVPKNRGELRAELARGRKLQLSAPAKEFAELLLGARMPWTMRPFWALHVAGAIGILPSDVRRIYGFPTWLPNGRVARSLIRLMLRAMDLGYGALPPVRRARRHLTSLRAQATS